MALSDAARIVVGRISGLYGVRGWVKVYSYTDPLENILDYRPWYLRRGAEWRALSPVEGQRHGKGVIARLQGCDNRDAARDLVGAEIAVARAQLPTLTEGEYYWSDLEGLRVLTGDGTDLGVVDHLLETGANDVLVVRGDRERLIPFVPGEVVLSVELDQGRLIVDWDPEF